MIHSLWSTIVVIVFGIQWTMFAVSYMFKTELFYDLTGSITYWIILAVVIYYKSLSTSQTIQLSLVAIWAIRLGSYLFIRILSKGEDRRFRIIKKNAVLFFTIWNVQAVWIIVTLYPSLCMGLASEAVPIQFINVVGWSIFIMGLITEIVADQQKWLFRTDAANENEFITTGLWKYSRHPNYFGEILLWSGMCFSCFSHILSFQDRLLASMSPILIATLIIRYSGIPILEKSADNRWNSRPTYQNYKKNTACLIPFIW